MLTIKLVLLLMALISFLLGAANIPWRLNWIALGLAFWVLSIILGG